MDEKNLGLIAAGVAFYSILAVFPTIASVIALWGVIGDPGAVVNEVARYRAILPDDVFHLIESQLLALSGADGLTLGWASVISFLLALWSARAGAAAMMRGLNAIYHVPNRSGFSHALRALLLTLALLGVAVTAIACVIVMPIVLAYLPLGRWSSLGLDILRWGLAIAVLMAGFSLIYRLGPNRRKKTKRARWIAPGAAFATVGWAAASIGFSYYLSNFGSYNEVYGSIGAVVVMLMWLFISAWLVLLGGAMNAALEAYYGGAKPSPEPPATATK